MATNQSNVRSQSRRWIIGGALAVSLLAWGTVSVFAALFGLLMLELRRPYQEEFDSIAGCLLRREMPVLNYAQHRDMFLEDYAFKVETPQGRTFQMVFWQSSPVRTCRDTITGLRWSETEAIDFSHPLIQGQLAHQQASKADGYVPPESAATLETVADFLSHADWILDLAETAPEILVPYDDQPQLLDLRAVWDL